MKFYLGIFVFIISLIIGNAVASDYPRSQMEKEIDEIGSLAGKGGIVLRSGKFSRSSSAEGDSHNEQKLSYSKRHLLDAAIDVLKFAPLSSVDSNLGVIITEWYSTKDDSKSQLKITVYIKENASNDDDIEVIVFERHLEKGQWSVSRESRAASKVLRNKILRKAKDLYIKSLK